MLTGKYLPAVIFYGAAAIWSACYWLSSDFIHDKIENVHSWQIGGVAVLLLMGVGSLWWTQRTKMEAELREFAGVLYPGSERINPSDICGSNLGPGINVHLGDSIAFIRAFPQTIIKVNDHPVLTLYRGNDDKMFISAVIRDEYGRVVVDMNENGFEVNPNNVIRMSRPSRSNLIVKDQDGDELLNVSYLNPQNIRIHARFHEGGKIFDTATFKSDGVCVIMPNTVGTGAVVNIESR